MTRHNSQGGLRDSVAGIAIRARKNGPGLTSHFDLAHWILCVCGMCLKKWRQNKIKPNASFSPWTIKRTCVEVCSVTDAVPMFLSKTYSQGQRGRGREGAKQQEGSGFCTGIIIIRFSSPPSVCGRKMKTEKPKNPFRPAKNKQMLKAAYIFSSDLKNSFNHHLFVFN